MAEQARMTEKKRCAGGQRSDEERLFLPNQTGQEIKNEQDKQRDDDHLEQTADIQQGDRLFAVCQQERVKRFLVYIEIALPKSAVFGKINKDRRGYIPHGDHRWMIFINGILEFTLTKSVVEICASCKPGGFIHCYK